MLAPKDLTRWPTPATARARADAIWLSRPRQLTLDLSETIELDPCWTCDGDGQVECDCGGKGCGECDGMGFVDCADCGAKGTEG